MPVINRKSRISEVLKLLYNAERVDLTNLQTMINEHKDVNTNDFVYCSFPKYLGVSTIEETFATHGTYRVKLIIDKINKFVLTGYLIYEPGISEAAGSELFTNPNRAYFIVFDNEIDEKLDFYELNLDTRIYSRINDDLTTEELHRNVDDVVAGGAGASLLRLQYDDATLGAPDNEKVTNFVIASGYPNKTDWGNILVIIKTTHISWSYVEVKSTEPKEYKWVGGGSDIVTPFDNTHQGTVIGIHPEAGKEGYIEHLATDSDGIAHVYGWDTKLDKLTTTSGLKAYIRNGSTDTSMDLVQTATTANTIPVRTSTGAINVADAVNSTEAVNKGQLDNKVDNYLPLDGSKAMTGNLDMNNHIINMKGAKIGNLGAGGDDDAISKGKAKELLVNKKTTTDEKSYIYGYDKNGEKSIDLTTIGKVQDVQNKKIDGTYESVVEAATGIAKLDYTGKLDKVTGTTTKDQMYIKKADGTQAMADIPEGTTYDDTVTASSTNAPQSKAVYNFSVAKKTAEASDTKTYAYGYTKDGQTDIDISTLGKVKDVHVNNTTVLDSSTGIANIQVSSVYTSTSENIATSAKTAKELNDRVNNLESIGRYLSGWKADEGKPATEPPTTLPYLYKRGDYFVVTVVGTTNYRPSGTQYDGTASTTEETDPVSVNDIYRFDGSVWTLTHYIAGTYIAAHDGTGTGTTHLENVIVTGDTTLDDLQVDGDATFTNSPTIPDGVNDTDAVSKQQLDKLKVAYITLTGTSGTLTDAERTKLLSNEPTNNFINKDNMLFKCVFYSAGIKAVYAISGESKIHVITVTLPAGTWNLVTYNLIQLLGNEAISGEPYHFPYHFITKFEDGKIKITLYTITLDNNKTLKQYEKELDISDLAKDKVGVGNVEGAKIWAGTKAEYDAIAAKDEATLYYVVDDATEAQGAMNFKGTCLFADLPTSGQKNGDYWVLTDTTGEHVGQAAIWSNTSSEWKLAGATLTVDSSLNLASTNAIQNKVVTVALNGTVKLTGDQNITGIKKFGEIWVGETNEYTKLFKDSIKHDKNGIAYEYSYPNKSGTFALTSDLTAIMQTVYDGMHPVNDVQIGFQAPAIPTGVTATWTDISSSYEGRYFKISSTSAAGTSEAESLPLPTVSINSAGDHNHDRGDMNITGLLRTAPSADSNVGDTMSIKHASGAFYNAGTAGGGSQRVYDINASYSRDTNVSTIGFNAASNWTGTTSVGGSHTHTATVSGSVYSSGAAVKPLTTTIKVWKRIA